MKQIVAIMTALILLLSLVACGDGSDSAAKPKSNDKFGSQVGSAQPLDLPTPGGTASLAGRSFPEIKEGECAVYLDDSFMAVQVHNPHLPLLKEGEYGEFTIMLSTETVQLYYDKNYSNIENTFYLLPYGENAYETPSDDQTPQILFETEGDLMTLVVNHCPAPAEDILAVSVIANGDKFEREVIEYSRGGTWADTKSGVPVATGENSLLYVTDLRQSASIQSQIDAYLSSGLPAPSEYGWRFFADGEFYALQYRGALVQQLTEPDGIVDGLDLKVYLGENGQYGGDSGMVVTEQGNKYTATITGGIEQNENRDDKVYCLVQGDVLSIFTNNWSILSDFNEAKDSFENLYVHTESTSSEYVENFIEFIEKVENDVWIYVGLAGECDAVQILRAKSEHGQYEIIDTLTGEQDAYIDHDVAADGYYYAVRGIKDGKIGAFRSLRTTEEKDNNARWYKGGGKYVRGNVSFLSYKDEGFNGFEIYDDSGRIVQTFNGSIDEQYEGDWDYRMVMMGESPTGYLRMETLVNISDSSLSYQQKTEYNDKDMDVEPILGEQSGSFTRCQ